MKNLLLKEQRKFDELGFDRSEWQAKDWRDQKTRHIALHIGKASGKLTGLFPARQPDVAVDLSIYRTQLINTHDLDPEAVTQPFTEEEKPYGPNSSVVAAFSHLSYYLEPAEHLVANDELRIEQVSHAIKHLNHAAVRLSVMYDFDLVEAHTSKLRSSLGDRADLLQLPQPQ
jgi:hypothetical protein